MWYVIEVGTSKTVAMTREKSVADMIATVVSDKPCKVLYSVK